MRTENGKMKSLMGFLTRFSLVHLLTYVAMGLLFMTVSNYSEHFSAPEMANYMRPIDDPMVALAIPMQIPRGLLLGLALYSFRTVIIGDKWGWLKLWGVLWTLTSLGAVITGPGSIEGLMYTTVGFGNPLIGVPEVVVQTLLFSFLFCSWERKASQTVPLAAAIVTN